MAITKDAIFKVANDLDAQGLNPTLAAVRKALGGGSFTTISDVMTEWKAKKAAKQASVNEPTPPALQEQLSALGADLWAMAISAASARLDAERQGFESTRMELETQRNEAVALADQVASELEASKVSAHALLKEHAALKATVEAMQTTLASASERAATAEARATEITRRADDLKAELDKVHVQNSELIKALATQNIEAAAVAKTKNKGATA